MAKKAAVREVVFVDNSKLLRAKEIVGWMTGVPAKKEHEAEIKTKFMALVAEQGVDKADYLEFVYVKLGGLVRTPEEQAEAEVKAKVAKAKLKGKPKKIDDVDEDEEEADEE